MNMDRKERVNVPRWAGRAVVIILALLSAAFTYNFWKSVLIGVGVGTASAALFSLFLTSSLEPAKVMSFLHGYHNKKGMFLLLYIALAITSFAATIGSLYHQMSNTILKETATAMEVSAIQSNIATYQSIIDSLSKRILATADEPTRMRLLKERDMWEKRLQSAIGKYRDVAPATSQKLAIGAIASLLQMSVRDLSLAFLLALAVLIEITIILFAIQGWGKESQESLAPPVSSDQPPYSFPTPTTSTPADSAPAEGY